MSDIHIDDLIEELHIPINHISIEGNTIYIGTVGTCLIKGNGIIKSSLNWEKIYEHNKEKLAELIYAMYQTKVDKLEITPKPDRVLELKFKGTEMYLPSVQYSYHTNGEWTFQRASIREK
ncbi:MAG TPA: hypothetical protein PLJ60_13330 [Chryseolinea sp.]|nr:hypothetical protein [Chryseolinea sp.]